MTATHQLPDALGAAEVEIVQRRPDGHGVVRLLTVMPGMTLDLNLDALTSIKLPCPPEPGIGLIGFDTDGDLWHHKDADGWHFGSRVESWEVLHATLGPLSVADAAVNLASAPAVPCQVQSSGSDRMLHLDYGRFQGQVRVFVTDGDLFGRAAVLEVKEAELVGMALLRFVDEHRRAQGGGQS